MTIDVTHEDDRESRLSRASNLPTPQTVKVKRLERRLDAADDAMARRKQNMGSMTPVRITADEDEWAARVAAIERERGAGSPVGSAGSASPKSWTRDTAPSVLNAAMGSVLGLSEEQRESRRSSSPVLGETSLAGGEQSTMNLSKKPAFIAGSSMAADSMAASSRAGSPTKLTDAERRERRQRRERKRRDKEAATNRKLLAARHLAKQMQDERRQYKASVRLERRRTMAATHTGGGGHHAPNGGLGGVGLGSTGSTSGSMGASGGAFSTARSGGALPMQDDDLMPPSRRRSDGDYNRSTSPSPGGVGGSLSNSLSVLLPPGGPKRRSGGRGGQHRALSPIQRRALSQSSMHSLSGLNPIGEQGQGENDQKARADAAALERRVHAKQQMARKLEAHEHHQEMQSQERLVRSEVREREYAEKTAKLASLEEEMAMQGAQRRDDFAAKEAKYWKLRKEQETLARGKGRGKFLANQEQRKQRLTNKWQSNEEVFVANATKLKERFPAACELLLLQAISPLLGAAARLPAACLPAVGAAG